MTAIDTDSRWHLDKKVPIALIVAMLAQFAIVVSLVSRLETKGDEHERRLVAIEQQRVSERLSSIEVQLVDAKALLLRMDARMDRRDERERDKMATMPR